MKSVKSFCEKLCREPETKGNNNIEKVQSNRSEECFDSKPKLNNWPEPSKLVPIERLRKNEKEELQHIPAGKVEKPKFQSPSLSRSADNLLDSFPRQKTRFDRKIPVNLDFDKVRGDSLYILTRLERQPRHRQKYIEGFYYSFPIFQFDRSRKKEKLSLNLGNNKLSVGPVSPRGHSDSRMVSRTSDLSPRPRKSSQVSKTSRTEVTVENGRRIERRTETLVEDGKETKLIFENDKLGTC